MIAKTNLSHKALTDWCDQVSQYDISESIEHSSSRPANSFLAWAPCCSTVIAYSSDFVCDTPRLMELGIKKDDVYMIFNPKSNRNLDELDKDNNFRNILIKRDGNGFEVGYIFKTNAPHSVLVSWCKKFPRYLQKHQERKYDDYAVYSFVGYMYHEGYCAEHLMTFQNYSSESVTLGSGILKDDIYTVNPEEGIDPYYSFDDLHNISAGTVKNSINDGSGISTVSAMNKSQHRCNPQATLAGLPILAYLDKMNCGLSPDIHCIIDADELNMMIELLC